MSRTNNNNNNNNNIHNNTEESIAIYWFRNALRLHDNPSLLDACRTSTRLIPLVIIDPANPFGQTPGRTAGCIRANFILESLHELHDKLESLEHRLVVVQGNPAVVLPTMCDALHVTDLYYEREPAAPIRASDAKVLAALRRCRGQERSTASSTTTTSTIQIHGYDTHTLHPMERYLALCKTGVAPATYGGFTKLFQKLSPVPDEVETITHVPPLPDDCIARLVTAMTSSTTSTTTTTTSTSSMGGGPDFTIPTLTDLGYDHPNESLVNRHKGGIEMIGGEEKGLALLERMMKRTQWICTFEKPKTSPNALTVDTTGLSPYVKHGCVSPRRFYHELSKVYAKFPAEKLSQPPVSLHGQLMWREYNNLMGYSTPHFDKMVGNPVARQIPWDDDPTLLAAWRDSQTGYPFIDAIMTQLKETGWIHHLARHAVACFLTRGDLWQSWEAGAAIFEERLIDADWSINNFNWQWLSCTAHFYQYFRCYSPVAFGKKTDPNGDYIRKWLPQFQKFPTKYIYEPWKAPLAVQQTAGVIIGKDYPEPIVDHTTISKSNMGRMKEAYDRHNQNGQEQPADDDDDEKEGNRSRRSRSEVDAGGRKRRRT